MEYSRDSPDPVTFLGKPTKAAPPRRRVAEPVEEPADRSAARRYRKAS